MVRLCTIPSCGRRHASGGWCDRHYRQWRRDSGGSLRDTRTLDQRYEDSVDRVTTPSGCHLWTAGTFDSGYGRFNVDRIGRRAHRWGHQRYVGPTPDGLVVRHTCDVRLCQNRNHWLLGTCKENTADIISRGRRQNSKGQSHHGTHLTDADVLAIRAAYVRGQVTQRSLAERYGVAPVTVSQIVNRTTWSHL